MAKVLAAVFTLACLLTVAPQPDPQQFNPCNPKIQKCA